MGRLPNSFTDQSPDSLQTPQTGLDSGSTGLNSASSQLNPKKNPKSMQHKANRTQREDDDSYNESRKRKLSFYQAEPLSIQKLEQEFLRQSEASRNVLPLQYQVDKNDPVSIDFDDGLFYEGINLDAVEEEATKYLKSRLEQSVQEQTKIPEHHNFAVLDAPTFDLGF